MTARNESTPVIGVHASHEQFTPGRLRDLIVRADAAGWDAAMCSDHWAPWSEAQGESGFAWSWLGAALEATSFSLGVVNAPGQRYHPAIIAQAAATLASMYPDRFWLAIGSGQLLNEHITADRWPSKPERNERLRESAEVMRQLWAGETVSHDGHVRVSEARLWTRPERPPLLVGAAVTAETAGWIGSWADALVTVSQPPEILDEIVDAFRSGGGAGKPMFLQVHLAWDPDPDVARAAAWDAWGQNCLSNSVMTDLAHPAQISAAATHVTAADLDGAVRISSDLDEHIAWLRADVERGFERLYLHEVGPEQERFVDTFARDVLPQLR